MIGLGSLMLERGGKGVGERVGEERFFGFFIWIVNVILRFY